MPDTQYIDIKRLTLLERNPRTISKEQFEKLCKSLQDDKGFFENRPCLVHDLDGKLEVYAGNQRVRAAKKIGWKQVPCIVESGLLPEVIKKRIILDNSHNGFWDFEELANSFETDLLLDSGFTMEQLVPTGKDLGFLEEAEECQQGEKKSKKCPSCGHEF